METAKETEPLFDLPFMKALSVGIDQLERDFNQTERRLSIITEPWVIPIDVKVAGDNEKTHPEPPIPNEVIRTLTRLNILHDRAQDHNKILEHLEQNLIGSPPDTIDIKNA